MASWYCPASVLNNEARSIISALRTIFFVSWANRVRDYRGRSARNRWFEKSTIVSASIVCRCQRG
jgi:hypothetical protein